MAAVLMPKQLFSTLAAEETAAVGVTSIEADSESARALAGRMASRFRVSREAASIRLVTLGCLRAPGQTLLPIA